MFRRFLPLSIAAAMLVAAPVLAQSQYLRMGASGFDVSGGYVSHADYEGALGTVGYSVYGILDIAGSIGVDRFAVGGMAPTVPTTAQYVNTRHLYTTTASAASTPIAFPAFRPDHISGTVYGPSATMRIVRQTASTPVSVFLSGAYEWAGFRDASSQYWNATGFTSRGYSVGASVRRDMALDRHVVLSPELGVEFLSARLRGTYQWAGATYFKSFYPAGGSDVAVDNTTRYVEYSLAMNVSYWFRSGIVLHASPELSLRNHSARYGVVVGITAPRSKMF